MGVAQLASHTIIIFPLLGLVCVAQLASQTLILFCSSFRFDGRYSTGLGLMVVTQLVNSQYFYFYFSSILTDVVQLASHTIITVFTSLLLELIVVTRLASHTIIFFFF